MLQFSGSFRLGHIRVSNLEQHIPHASPVILSQSHESIYHPHMFCMSLQRNPIAEVNFLNQYYNIMLKIWDWLHNLLIEPVVCGHRTNCTYHWPPNYCIQNVYSKHGDQCSYMHTTHNQNITYGQFFQHFNVCDMNKYTGLFRLVALPRLFRLLF